MDNETLQKLIRIVELYFEKDSPQICYGVSKSDTIINCGFGKYITQTTPYRLDTLYRLAEIDELKHLSKTN
jgi:hypothetical protein